MHDADLATAERLAHTLKGVAGNLGAVALQHCAGDLETCLRNLQALPAPALQVQVKAKVPAQAEVPVQAALQATADTLQQLLMALRQALPNEAGAAPMQAPQWSAAQRQAGIQTLHALRQLLRADDASAQELWNQHRAVLRSLVQRPAELDAAIEGFDFEQALALLESAPQ